MPSPGMDHELVGRESELGIVESWVRLLGSGPTEETYLVVVAARNEDVARRWSEAADLPIDHVTEIAQIPRGVGRDRRPIAVLEPTRAGR